MHLAEAADHGLLGLEVVLDGQAGVFIKEAVQGFGELLLVTVFLCRQGQAENGLGIARRHQVEVVLVVGVVEDGVPVDVVHPGHGADVAGNADFDLGLGLALDAQQVTDLEGLAGVADEELGVGCDRALVDAEQAEFAAEGVVAHLEDVGDDVLVGVGGGLDGFGGRAFTLQEAGWVAFGGVGQQAAHDVQELADAGARAGRGEAHGDQVALAQGDLEGVVELRRLQGFTLFEVEGHQLFIHLDHLVDDAVVGLAHAGESRYGVVVGLEEAVDDAGAPRGGQVDGQAFLAEAGADALHQGAEVHGRGVDAIDHDHPAFVGGELHDLAGQGFDAGGGVDDHHRGFHRRQGRQGPAEEVGQARGVEDVHPVLGPFQVGEGAVEGVAEGFLLGVVVADRVALLDRTGCADGAGGGQQFLQQRGLAAAGLAEEAEVADVADRGGCHACSLVVRVLKTGCTDRQKYLPPQGPRQRLRSTKRCHQANPWRWGAGVGGADKVGSRCCRAWSSVR